MYIAIENVNKLDTYEIYNLINNLMDQLDNEIIEKVIEDSEIDINLFE